MNSFEYWEKREAEQQKHNFKEEAEYDKEIERIYREMLDSVENEINAFYGRYASKENITIAEAKKRVSELDIKAYERKAKRYVKDKDFSKEANEEMRLYNLTMKVNRLELLKANIGLELVKGHDELEKFMGEILKGRTMEELERQAGILGNSIKDNAKMAHAIVNASFHNATFSNRIWQYHDLMKADLSKLLQTGLIQGKNPRVLAKELRKYFIGEPLLKNGKNGAVYATERLMRTELARVQIEAQKQSFIANGFKEYTFHTLGDCCDICRPLNGKHFKIKDMQAGLNAPPIHPHCRCSTSAYENSDDYEAWLNYLDKGGTTKDWRKMSKEQKAQYKVTTKQAEPKPKNLSDKCKQIIASLQKRRIACNEVEKHAKPLTAIEVINTLAGGDMTGGSCASVGLAYVGQKGGLNVLDFRGGKSQDYFSGYYNLREIAKLPNVKTYTETARAAATAGNKLLKQVEADKEYYFVAGRHAAIVRKNEEGKLQYLELQSATRSGWNDFDGNPRHTLHTRFGCTAKGYDIEAFMFEVDSMKDSEDLKEILGYLNTADSEQRKGKHGTIK